MVSISLSLVNFHAYLTTLLHWAIFCLYFFHIMTTPLPHREGVLNTLDLSQTLNHYGHSKSCIHILNTELMLNMPMTKQSLIPRFQKIDHEKICNRIKMSIKLPSCILQNQFVSLKNYRIGQNLRKWHTIPSRVGVVMILKKTSKQNIAHGVE